MPGGSDQQKRTALSLQALLDVATQRLVTHSLDALTSLVTPSVLARSSNTVSVDTAYRLLDSPEHTIQMLTNRVLPPEFSSGDLEWPAFDAVTLDAMGSSGGASSLEAVHSALVTYISNNFSLASAAIGRLVDAATITASDAWTGSLRIRDDRIDIARQIRAERVRAVRSLDEGLSWMVRTALIQLRRRPRTGLSFETMVVLLHSFADGCIDRALLDPESLQVDEIATAMIDLGFTLSEDGLLPEAAERFEVDSGFPLEAAILASDRLWRSGQKSKVLEAVAVEIEVDPTTIRTVFPTDTTLAEAVLQALVIGVPIAGRRETRLALLSGALHRLAQTADEAPTMLKLAQKHPSGAIDELRGAAHTLASESTTTSVPTDRLSDQLVTSACRGVEHWATTKLLLDLIRT